MRQIALLGSTGSIGHSTLEVVRRHRDRFTVRSLAAGDNVSQLSRQIEEFAPRIVSVRTRSAADALQAKFPGITVLSGAEGIAAVASAEGTDTVVAAITGTAALEATVIAIRRGIRLCLANKETLVAAGDLIQKELARSQSELLPIDSEQSAIFQSLAGNHRTEVRRLILTASGGPFWRRPVEEFSAITVAEALAHPTWSMGRKITIDSATLINKALEIIEAHYLFQMPAERIEAVIHPQSVVHSMVEYTDGSVIAQLSPPDMKIPILYSLSYPERLPMTGHPLDLARLGRLEFYPIDPKRFPAV
ncbi:MAG TPA: 1-deoxy-D-xylulose-5-phosphate reductoisomerase, partial [Candidatus Aminicenantes bacterium]|nr:1-deoxy-D-xylulose-5-phosphate reductoisomerase [Candidatus Aminicenantes bacterium]